MPINHHFYVECLGADGWVVPPGFEAEPWTFECDRPLGGFAWAHPRCGWLDLFWGTDVLFPMRLGPPIERRGSALLRYLDQFYDYGRNEDALCWLPYQELFIDAWDTDMVTVWSKVPVRHALFFGNGQRSFPSAELLAAGISEMELDRLHQGWLAREPVDITFGMHRFRLSQLPPDHDVKVTWRESISAFVGEPYASVFKRLRQYGRDEDLRILSKRG